ncbi:MAG TPA: hypothetical protein VFM77_07860 [Terriglobales bacterium]|nr:hypothetical protein [Terriglobales bacterium]
MKLPGLQRDSALQGLYKGEVLGYVIVLLADPLCDCDPLANGPLDNHSNARGSRVAQRPAIYVCHQIHLYSASYNMR